MQRPASTTRTYNVEMVYALCAIRSVVDHDPESARTLLLAQHLGHVHHVAEKGLLVLPCLGKLCQAVTVFGNDQEMDGGLWRHVPKGDAQIVVVDLVGRNVSRQDLVENGWRGTVSGAAGSGLLGLLDFVGRHGKGTRGRIVVGMGNVGIAESSGEGNASSGVVQKQGSR